MIISAGNKAEKYLWPYFPFDLHDEDHDRNEAQGVQNPKKEIFLPQVMLKLIAQVYWAKIHIVSKHSGYDHDQRNGGDNWKSVQKYSEKKDLIEFELPDLSSE